MAGNWTVTTISTQGHGSFSGTAAVSQSGQGLGANGSTTLAAAAIGQIAVTQTGTALTGIIANSMQKVGYNFIGTLSSGNLTITGSTPCYGVSNSTQSTTSITGTITSNSATGTYTITRSGCYYTSSDAGTFVATKQ
jgi:hypothetical protein